MIILEPLYINVTPFKSRNSVLLNGNTGLLISIKHELTIIYKDQTWLKYYNLRAS